MSQSLVRDPNSLPAPDSPEQLVVRTAWRPDKLREMTYTQFWQLISERQVDRVRARTSCSRRIIGMSGQRLLGLQACGWNFP